MSFQIVFRPWNGHPKRTEEIAQLFQKFCSEGVSFQDRVEIVISDVVLCVGGNFPIGDLEISPRVMKLLHAIRPYHDGMSQPHTVYDLLRLSPYGLLQIYGFGTQAFQEVCRAVEAKGFTLPDCWRGVLNHLFPSL